MDSVIDATIGDDDARISTIARTRGASYGRGIGTDLVASAPIRRTRAKHRVLSGRVSGYRIALLVSSLHPLVLREIVDEIGAGSVLVVNDDGSQEPFPDARDLAPPMRIKQAAGKKSRRTTPRTRKVVAGPKCPKCGTPLIVTYGAPRFTAPGRSAANNRLVATERFRCPGCGNAGTA